VYKRTKICVATILVLGASLGMAVRADAGASPAEKCEAGKNGTAGKYAACLHKARQKFVSGGSVDTAGRDKAVLACGTKFTGQWASLEEKAGLGICPSEGDATSIQDFLGACVSSAEDALAGGALPADVELFRTGQTGCYNAAGTVVPCAGTGQDGELQLGVARSFTDNGDGTVTDNKTGLMWEKLTNDSTIHDWDNYYTWADAFASKIATLNSTSFAGHNDWRLPNRRELDSLLDLGVAGPAVSPEFYTLACWAPGCAGPTCSCTKLDDYWSSTTFGGTDRTLAWSISFTTGSSSPNDKAFSLYVRAVRTAS